MPIQIFKGNIGDLGVPLLKREIHIICIAVADLTDYKTFTHVIGKMPYELAGQIADSVNKKNETETLYPKFNLTIIPLTIFNSRNDFGNKVKMKKHIADCFEIEEKFIHSSKIIFDFERRDDFDRQLAIEVLLEDFIGTELNVEYLNL